MMMNKHCLAKGHAETINSYSIFCRFVNSNWFRILLDIRNFKELLVFNKVRGDVYFCHEEPSRVQHMRANLPVDSVAL